MIHRARHPVFLPLILAVLISGTADDTPRASPSYPNPVPLRVSGLLGDGTGPIATVAPKDADEASYLPGSNVLQVGDRLLYLPPGASVPVRVPAENPGARASVEASREWLARGIVPGRDPSERDLAERALLDLRLLTGENGATLAGPSSRWRYVWPRDASFTAAAFAATGHHEEAGEILSFLASIQEDDGGWEARYRRSGDPVLDGRDRQLDANGWFLWAAWYVHATDPDPDRADDRTRDLWPAIIAAADGAADSLGTDGLPPGGADYWEIPTWRPNIGTAAPLRTGLRSTADLAEELGHCDRARRYAVAAGRLDAAIEREFAPHGYPRTTRSGSGADAAVNFLAPPFAPEEPRVSAAVDDAARRLTTSNGGVVPGERWPQDPEVAWTPETAFFALSAAASGDTEEAERRLDWLAAHRTVLGSFPEKVDGDGDPQAAAPLAWTSSIVVLTLATTEEPPPVPPE